MEGTGVGSQAATWVLGALGIAALLVFVPVLSRWSQYFEVFVHESGHALVALLTGKFVAALEVARRGGGCPYTAGGGCSANPATALAGYSAPSAAGLSLVAALHQGVDPRTLLLVVLAVPAVMLLFARDAFTVVVIVGVLAAIAVLVHHAGPVSQATAVVIAAAVLLLWGLRSSLGLVQFEGGGTDVQHLTERTGLPAGVWVVAFAGFAAYAIYQAGRWLLTQPVPLPS
jgi:hypothetical protein